MRKKKSSNLLIRSAVSSCKQSNISCPINSHTLWSIDHQLNEIEMLQNDWTIKICNSSFLMCVCKQISRKHVHKNRNMKRTDTKTDVSTQRTDWVNKWSVWIVCANYDVTAKERSSSINASISIIVCRFLMKKTTFFRFFLSFFLAQQY